MVVSLSWSLPCLHAVVRFRRLNGIRICWPLPLLLGLLIDSGHVNFVDVVYAACKWMPSLPRRFAPPAARSILARLRQ